MGALMMVEKDPDATLDYKFNWVEWLDGDLLDPLNCIWVAPADLTIVAQSFTPEGECTVRLSGGLIDQVYDVVNYITTDTGEKDNRTLMVTIREK